MDVTKSPDDKFIGCCELTSQILSRFGDKWTGQVVMLLIDSPKRFGMLKRLIGGVSPRMLTLTLRALERDGLVIRTQFPTIPPRVEYELTPLGRSLRGPLQALGAWALENHQRVAKARATFDARPT